MRCLYLVLNDLILFYVYDFEQLFNTFNEQYISELTNASFTTVVV